MLGCLVLTLPLEWLFGARVYRRFGAVLVALLPVVTLFSVWDIVGIIRDHWTYNPRYVTGLQLVFEMPIEELVFFIVIPLCGLLTYEAVGSVLHGRVRLPGWPTPSRPRAADGSDSSDGSDRSGSSHGSGNSDRSARSADPA